MTTKTYTLEPGQKATQVMIGTPDTLIWGDLITREQTRISAFLNTLAEDFVPLSDANVLFLAPAQQMAPVPKPRVHIKLEEILFFYGMGESEPLPEQTEMRRLVPVEAFVGSYRIEGMILKSPIADLHTMLLVAKELYTTVYQAKTRHVAKPWLGVLTSDLVQVRLDRLTMTTV
jgi:hypothetical protein